MRTKSLRFSLYGFGFREKVPMKDVQNQGWHSALTAGAYEAFAQAYPLYTETARHLVDTTRIAPGERLVDLACGTGIVTESILARLGDACSIVSVDASTAMLEVARRKTRSPNVRFVHTPAERLREAVSHPIDAVLCNSAFWQLKWGEALPAIAAVLASDGRLVFNMPRQFFCLSYDSAPLSAPTLEELMREIAIRDYGWAPSARPPRRLDLPLVTELLASHGFRIESLTTRAHVESAAGQVAFLRIPVMTERRFPGLIYTDRMAILEKAARRFEGCGGIDDWTWSYFVVRQIKDDS